MKAEDMGMVTRVECRACLRPVISPIVSRVTSSARHFVVAPIGVCVCGSSFVIVTTTIEEQEQKL